MKRFGKKGSAHFEMVISFVFFMGFVFFLFLVLKPYGSTNLTDFVVSGLRDTFEEEAGTNLTEMFLKINPSGVSTCFEVSLANRLFNKPLTNSRVFELSGDYRKSELDVVDGFGSLSNLIIEDASSFYFVKISPEFVGETVGPPCTIVTDFQFGNIIEREVISNSSFHEISKKYYLDYNGLKNDLKVPDLFDFSITSVNFPDIDMIRPVPENEEAIAKDYLMEVIYKNGTEVNALITFKVW